ncbi:MAG TPA: DUF4838 domain-containing protein, partial [Mesonia sp.]|nr:DUF4838 domain-containing protein [Mesonia sp.]
MNFPRISYQNIFLILTFLSFYTIFAQTKPTFSYREAYFPQVSNSRDFQLNYKVNSLDNYWGLWGHNLPKWVDNESNIDEEIYALVDDERTKKQFCFSSKKLRKIIEKNIEERKGAYKHFMISPNDNQLVCLCEHCKKLGNTSKSASPAVFFLLNELAEDHKGLHFFTTAYLSTSTPAEKEQPKNIGIFYSTVNFQKGKPYNLITNKNELVTDLENWTKKVSQIYAWEYVLNYDNYFDFYPNLYVLQENLKFLNENGVNGIFINGSESYSSLQEMKAAVIAKLLYNVEIDLEKTIVEEFEKRFPPKIASLVSKFYLDANKSFYESKADLNTYADINATKRKYLPAPVLFDFYKELKKLSLKTKDQNTLKLVLATTFLKLEYLRILGLKEFGYVTQDHNEVKIKPEVFELLIDLEKLAEKTKIGTYNEQGFLISDYLKNWRKEILNQDKKNLFLNLNFEVISNLDHGYNNKDVLNDVSYGF